ncbi:uncharacterized protein DUF2183 [Anseongella ginsenosidimutans]|uniref:Uncharacterized protein DUF2183 n=1 Tax=Anseongella ginsenosidimutans TaxID=496056 RepID=A0A4R3KUV1_9SPHI|nr:phosphatase domain-containing protein [Anseongella ginsenosidimutans]QEC51841.1 DUF2183 domain-containing protein [Anseongella ginsenosidimutans]TCS89217.1 uncharacterized protein DUF2183 [Anseongella ginsenosidimutans]
MKTSSVSVKVYHGYGHTHNLTVYGHVFKWKSAARQRYSNRLFANIAYLFNLFMLKTYPFARIRLKFREQEIYNKAEYDGFFRFEFASISKVNPGWHEVKVEALEEDGQVAARASGLIYVPHITQYAIISDIDDTIMVSHSATIGRRLRELFIKNPRTRKTFPGMAHYYKRLSAAFASHEKPNPFFYVSSSEWNLYDYLLETFRFNKLPEGAFLLNQLKEWKDLLKTGKTGHTGKLLRVMRIIDTFPNQKFVLFGDNSQQDPDIYSTIAEKYPRNIAAIYIRDVYEPHSSRTQELLEKLSRLNIETLQFRSSQEALDHSQRVGLLESAPIHQGRAAK